MVRARQRKIVLEDHGGRKAGNVFLQPPLCRAEQNHHSSTTHCARLKRTLSKQDTYLGDLTASLNNMHQLLQNWTAGIHSPSAWIALTRIFITLDNKVCQCRVISYLFRLAVQSSSGKVAREHPLCLDYHLDTCNGLVNAPGCMQTSQTS